MQKKPYEAPRTTKTDVELEQGFMNASVFPKPENTEDLKIQDHVVDEKFDFSDKSTWNNSAFTQD